MIELRSGPARLEVLPEIGGRIHQLWLSLDGQEEPLLVSPDEPADHAKRPLHGGCFTMAPWPNRIAGSAFPWAGQLVQLPPNDGPNALHGLVFERPWQVVARAGNVVELRCELGSVWPWDGYAWQRFELSESGLLIKAEVRSQRETFPAGIGLHPWFRRTVDGAVDASIEVPSSTRYVLNDQLPTGERVSPEGPADLRRPTPIGDRELDDCYTGMLGPMTIDWGRVFLEMSVECAEPHAMVHTTPAAVCLEPQTCAPDAFNLRTKIDGTGFATTEPGRAVALVSRWKWRIN